MKNQKAVYTFLAGNYDDIQPIGATRPDWDYICFSSDLYNRGIREKNGWTIRPIPFSHRDPKRVISFCKILSHKVLPEYRYSLSVDANVRFVSEWIYDRAGELISQKCTVAHMSHNIRDCVYDEIHGLTFHGMMVSKLFPLMKAYRFLKKEGYPEHYGLLENNIIFREHNNPEIVSAMELWWKLYMRFDRRDQVEGQYYYWKSGLKPELFLPVGQNTRNNPDKFEVIGHNVSRDYLNYADAKTRMEKVAMFLRIKRQNLIIKFRRYVGGKVFSHYS